MDEMGISVGDWRLMSQRGQNTKPRNLPSISSRRDRNEFMRDSTLSSFMFSAGLTSFNASAMPYSVFPREWYGTEATHL